MTESTVQRDAEDLLVTSSSRVPQQSGTAHVVVGVQGDDSSVAALQWAARSARARGVKLEALMAWELPELPHALPPELRTTAQSVVGDLRWALEAIVERSGVSAGPPLAVSTTVVTTPAKAALADAVRRANLIVLGTAQHAAALAALSVARQTAATANCPVALVPPNAASGAGSSQASGDRYVVGMDGSPQSIAALHWACEEAELRRLSVQAVTVALSPEASEQVSQALAAESRAHPRLRICLTARRGDPGEVLASMARGSEALVVGQHGLGAIARRLPSLGSVSRWCAAHPTSPVVVVPWRRTRATK